MPSTSPDPLARRAEDLTARNSRGGGAGVSPPPAAGQSPFHEVLIEEVAAALPEPVARELRSAPTVGRVQDWLVAGSLYGLTAGDPYLGRRFLAELAGDPRRAAEALARALAARLPPPPLDAERRLTDRVGLLLQLILACGLLLGRAFLFAVAGQGLPPVALPGPAALLRGLVGLDLLTGPAGAGLAGSALLAGAAAWLCLEALAGPPLLEAIRRGPARLRGLPPPLAGRADAFHLVWLLQATLLLGAFGARALLLAAHDLSAAACPLAQCLADPGVVLLIAGLLGLVGWRSAVTMTRG